MKASEYSRLSVRELKEKIKIARKKYEYFNEIEKKYRKYVEKHYALENKIRKIDDKILEIESIKEKLRKNHKPSIIDRLQGLTIKPEIQSELDRQEYAISQMRAKKEPLLDKLDSLKWPDYPNMKDVREGTQNWWSSLEALERALNGARAREEKEFKRKKELGRHKALSAAYQDKTRELGDAIKRQIRDQLKKYSYCPYCSKLLGDSPHVDHIYPISKGGLSTPENMVFICMDCNLMKGTLTLREFIKKRKLDRDKIEEILENLCKTF